MVHTADRGISVIYTNNTAALQKTEISLFVGSKTAVYEILI